MIPATTGSSRVARHACAISIGLVLSLTTSARAEDSCPDPGDRDSGPLLRAIDEDNDLGYLIQNLWSCANGPYGPTSNMPTACKAQIDACRTEWQHHQQTQSDHDESGFLSDIEGGWLGQQYKPLDDKLETVPDSDFSCDETDPDKLSKMAQGRWAIAQHHRVVLDEWGRWKVWAWQVASQCRQDASSVDQSSNSDGSTSSGDGSNASGDGSNAGGDGSNAGVDDSSAGAGSDSADNDAKVAAVENSSIGQAYDAGEAIDNGIALGAQMHGRGKTAFYTAFTLVMMALPHDTGGAMADTFAFRRYHWLRAPYDLGFEYGLDVLAGSSQYYPPKLGGTRIEDFFATARPQVSFWWHWLGGGAFLDWNAARFGHDGRPALAPGLQAAFSLGGIAHRSFSLTVSTRMTLVGGSLAPAFRVLAHGGIVDFIYEWQKVPMSGEADGHIQIFALGFGVTT